MTGSGMVSKFTRSIFTGGAAAVVDLLGFRKSMTGSGMVSKFTRYIFTGGAAAVVDLLGFRILLLIAPSIVFAAVVSWLIAAFVNYNLTRRFVFNRAASPKGALHFLVGAAIGLCVNVGATLLFVTQFGFDPFLSKLTGIGIAFIFNFLLNALWVFK